MSFFQEFVRSPATVGAIAASGPALTDVATAAVPRTGSPVVVELGPGTGVFTEAIQRRLAGNGRHIAVELNSRFAEQLASRHPRGRCAPPSAETGQERLRAPGEQVRSALG
jgi:phospholipid N-methyltransferase